MIIIVVMDIRLGKVEAIETFQCRWVAGLSSIGETIRTNVV